MVSAVVAAPAAVAVVEAAAAAVVAAAVVAAAVVAAVVAKQIDGTFTMFSRPMKFDLKSQLSFTDATVVNNQELS